MLAWGLFGGDLFIILNISTFETEKKGAKGGNYFNSLEFHVFSTIEAFWSSQAQKEEESFV